MRTKKKCETCYYSEIYTCGDGWCEYEGKEINADDIQCEYYEPQDLVFNDEPDFWGC